MVLSHLYLYKIITISIPYVMPSYKFPYFIVFSNSWIKAIKDDDEDLVSQEGFFEQNLQEKK